MEIGIRVRKDGLLEPTIEDRRWLLTKLHVGKEYKGKITNSRNIKHLGKYWLLMKALEFHFDNTDRGWDLYFKYKFLPLIEFKVNNETKLFPSSIAFDNMSQIEFDDYYKKIENHLNENSYSIDELISTMEN